MIRFTKTTGESITVDELEIESYTRVGQTYTGGEGVRIRTKSGHEFLVDHTYQDVANRLSAVANRDVHTFEPTSNPRIERR